MVHASIIIASNCVETDIRFVLIVLNVQTFAEIFKKNITEIKINYKKHTLGISNSNTSNDMDVLMWCGRLSQLSLFLSHLSFFSRWIYGTLGYIFKICVFLNTWWTFELHAWWIMCHCNCLVWWTQFIYMRFASYRRILSFITLLALIYRLLALIYRLLVNSRKKIRWGKNSVIYNFENYGLVV